MNRTTPRMMQLRTQVRTAGLDPGLKQPVLQRRLAALGVEGVGLCLERVLDRAAAAVAYFGARRRAGDGRADRPAAP